MEGLLNQVRLRFSGKEEFGSTRDRRTSSFRGGRKPQKWPRRQLPRQMSFKEPTEEAEYAAAVAAAAFAITSLESDNTDQRTPDVGLQFSLPRIISGIVDRIAAAAEPGEALKRNSDEYYHAEEKEMIPEKTIHPVPSIRRIPTMPKKRLTFADEQQDDTSMPYNFVEMTPNFDEEEPEDAKKMKPVIPFTTKSPSVKRTPTFGEGRSPSVRRTSTFGEEQLQNSKTRKQESSAPGIFPPSPIRHPPSVPPLIQPTAPPKRAQETRRGRTDTDTDADADAWEIDEMAKIKQRYEKLNATILEWEEKKKKKARRKLETKESNQGKRKAKALQNYQIEMERIKQIADGARAQAKEKRRNEELKVMDKANKYRATGEPPLPPMCLCL
ncbi:hypothetical protein SOVF_046420 [Spinacia oleracea]|uniref:Uncharacterized protein isoform X2 n=1 Tax=Spinacia oleracea TaxID=3562 RepID=A0A9R0JG61_SPIOL|nr:uncharacterized protein LOC110805033 isoform X2 [Spinacia oleracea]KNA21094.1 hypothetical protein SOVF_046420 [Spinacia oleracea]